MIFWLFQKELSEKEAAEALERLEHDDRFARVRCPECKWRPDASSLWYCGDCSFPERFFGGCGTGWNTFETRGVCPGCKHQWRWTACLRCEIWSLHDDWYSDESEEV